MYEYIKIALAPTETRPVRVQVTIWTDGMLELSTVGQVASLQFTPKESAAIAKCFQLATELENREAGKDGEE